VTKKKFPAALCILLLSFGCAQGINIKKFEQVDRAARSAGRSLSGGADFEQFGEELQKLSSEISRLKGRVKSDKEQELLKAYSELLIIYQDGLVLWKYKTEAARYDFIPRGLIYVGQDVEPIVEKYSIPTEYHIPGDSVRMIWINANSQLEKIDALLRD
jgi:hypothetical protein